MPQKFIYVSRATHTLITLYCTQKGLDICDFAQKAIRHLYHDVLNPDLGFLELNSLSVSKQQSLPPSDTVGIAVSDDTYRTARLMCTPPNHVHMWEFGDLAVNSYLGKVLLQGESTQIDWGNSLFLADALFNLEDLRYGDGVAAHLGAFYWGDVYFKMNDSYGIDQDLERGIGYAIAEHVCKGGEVITLYLESSCGSGWEDIPPEEREDCFNDCCDWFWAHITGLEVTTTTIYGETETIEKTLKGTPTKD